MSSLPPIMAGGRGGGISLVVLMAVGQAASAAVAAFATRDVFAALGAGGAEMPVAALIAIAAAGIATALFRIGGRVVAERVGQDYAGALRIRLFTHVSRLPARKVAGKRSGALSMRFVGDLTAVRNWVSLGISRLISSGIVLPAATVTLFLIDPRLGTAALAPLLLGILIMWASGLRLGRLHRRLRSRRARLAAEMTERVGQAPELRLLGRTDQEVARLRRRTARLTAAALARARASEGLKAVPDAVSGMAAAAVLTSAFLFRLDTALAAGALAAVALMVQPLRDLAGVWDRHRAWTAARSRCEALLATPPLPRKRSRRRLPSGPLPLVFRKVSGEAVERVSIEAGPGRRVAILGPNGAGKSGLLALAAGLEQPSTGKVKLGGRAVTDLSTNERQRAISLVSSRSPVLAGSLRRALTLGLRRRPKDAVILAEAEAFGLAGLIERLGGLDGRIAEGGRNLSSGELRRVLLTRAALASPGLLLLDEPDDALDAGAQALIERVLASTEATVLMVTHDPKLARLADEVWFVEAGRIVEAGPPRDLLEGSGPAGRFFGPRSVA